MQNSNQNPAIPLHHHVSETTLGAQSISRSSKTLDARNCCVFPALIGSWWSSISLAELGALRQAQLQVDGRQCADGVSITSGSLPPAGTTPESPAHTTECNEELGWQEPRVQQAALHGHCCPTETMALDARWHTPPTTGDQLCCYVVWESGAKKTIPICPKKVRLGSQDDLVS